MWLDINGGKHMKNSRYLLLAILVVFLMTGFTYADSYKKIEITADKLNVRNDMSLDSTVLGQLDKGTIVETHWEEDGWYTLSYKGQESYISEEYTTLISDYIDGSINGRQVNFRSLPSVTDGEVIRQMDFEKVSIYNKENDWCLVSDALGNKGYVFADFVTVGVLEEKTVVSRSEKRSDLIAIAKSRLGSPYKWGAEGPNSFDCSGFILYSFKEAYGINLGHSSKAMSKKGTTINKADLVPGDLVFFTTDRSGNVNHVGIYLGGGEFIHASSSKYNGKQVAISNLNTGFYSEVYKWGKRIQID